MYNSKNYNFDSARISMQQTQCINGVKNIFHGRKKKCIIPCIQICQRYVKNTNLNLSCPGTHEKRPIRGRLTRPAAARVCTRGDVSRAVAPETPSRRRGGGRRGLATPPCCSTVVRRTGRAVRPIPRKPSPRLRHVQGEKRPQPVRCRLPLGRGFSFFF